MSIPRFVREAIGSLDNTEFTSMNTLLTIGDINSNGLIDVVVSGRSGYMVWFENPGNLDVPWKRHPIDTVENQECGGITYDLTGNGYVDLINGGDGNSSELSWWQNPGPSGETWQRHIIYKTNHNQFHDERVGDITGDGRLSLVFWNNGDGALYWAPLPKDPTISPWPHVELIARDRRVGKWSEEGLAIVDLDGDGQNEIVAGTHWYKYTNGTWTSHQFAEDYISTVVSVADLDGDGQLELLLSEGDAMLYGKREGKFAWFKPRNDIRQLWEEHLVADDLLEPHTLQVGDISGNGHPDVVVGEIGHWPQLESRPPRLFVYENDGTGHLTPHLIDEGTGNHHARLVDLTNNGRLDIVSRPLLGDHKWNVYVWYNEG